MRAPRHDPPVILLIDDSWAQRDLYRVALSDAFLVRVTDVPERGLRIAQTDRPDLIVVDLDMAAMDGCELCRRLRAHPITEATPVLALTARTDGALRDGAIAAGVRDVLIKPCSTDRLRQRIGQVLFVDDAGRQLF